MWASTNSYLLAFIVLFSLRYVRTLVNGLVFFNIRNVGLRHLPVASPGDATVILASLLSHDITACLQSILATGPHEVLLVVPVSKLLSAQTLLKHAALPRVRVLTTLAAHKRQQMVAGLQQVRTSISVFVDDDVFWHPYYLRVLLSGLDDPRVGAAGTNQRVVRAPRPSI